MGEQPPQYQEEELLKLDTWNLQMGWQALNIKSEMKSTGCQYGFFPLNAEGSKEEFLVFGGIINNFTPYGFSNETAVLRIDPTDMEKSELVLLRNEATSQPELLPVKDRFYLNQYFPITHELSDEFLEKHVSPEKQAILRDCRRKRSELIGVVGRIAFHIFDKSAMTWICSSESLGYAKIIGKSD